VDCEGDKSHYVSYLQVSDFGTAKLLKTMHGALVEPETAGGFELVENRDDLLMTRGVGTLLWSAPEVLAGKRYSLPADVYSYVVIITPLT
jgi:serine/threonine protein kinase